jgi:hypothetical protein
LALEAYVDDCCELADCWDLTGALLTTLFEVEFDDEFETLLVAGVWTGVTGGAGRAWETTAVEFDCAGAFDELATFGDCGTSLAETAEEDRFGAGALHALGAGAGCDSRADSSERSDVGGAVAA